MIDEVANNQNARPFDRQPLETQVVGADDAPEALCYPHHAHDDVEQFR